jgi:hypothetical protein
LERGVTKSEQHQMIDDLRSFRSTMGESDLREFEMLMKRDRDDEEFDVLARRKLEELHTKYVIRRKKADVEELWNKLTKRTS